MSKDYTGNHRFVNNAAQQRCACGMYTDGTWCYRCGEVIKCRCDKIKPVESVGETIIRVNCGCSGSSTGKTTLRT